MTLQNLIWQQKIFFSDTAGPSRAFGRMTLVFGTLPEKDDLIPEILLVFGNIFLPDIAKKII